MNCLYDKAILYHGVETKAYATFVPNSDSNRLICLSQRWTRFPHQPNMVVSSWYFLSYKTSLLLPFSPRAWHITPDWNNLDRNFSQLEVCLYSTTLLVFGMCFFFFFFKSRHGKWSTHVRESSPLDRTSAFSHCWPPPVKHCLLPKINPHRLPFSEWPRTPTRVFPQLGENEVAKPEAKFFSWEVLSTLWKMLPLV